MFTNFLGSILICLLTALLFCSLSNESLFAQQSLNPFGVADKAASVPSGWTQQGHDQDPFGPEDQADDGWRETVPGQNEQLPHFAPEPMPIFGQGQAAQFPPRSTAGPMAVFESELHRKISLLTAKYKRASEEERQLVETEINDLLEGEYEEYLRTQQAKYDAMAKKLEDIRKQLEKRKAIKDEVIQTKAKSIIDSAKGIGWPEKRSEGTMPVYIPRQTRVSAQYQQSPGPFAPDYYPADYMSLRNRLKGQSQILSQSRSLSPNAQQFGQVDQFIERLEVSSARQLLKKKTVDGLRSEVVAHSGTWISLIEHFLQQPADELVDEVTYVFDDCLIVSAPDAKLYLQKTDGQWYIDYEKTVETFPAQEEDDAH